VNFAHNFTRNQLCALILGGERGGYFGNKPQHGQNVPDTEDRPGLLVLKKAPLLSVCLALCVNTHSAGSLRVNVTSIFFFHSCADPLLLWAENFYTTWRLRGTLKVFVICIIRIFTIKIENSNCAAAIECVRQHFSYCAAACCAGAFQLMRGRAPAQLRGNVAPCQILCGMHIAQLLTDSVFI
jgi:hypothetical protein